VTVSARVSWQPAAFGAMALLSLSACENDVAIQLLPPPPPAPAICVDGDPCSGRAWALSFHGPYDRIEIPSSPQLDLPQDFALEAWVWIRSYDSGHGVLNRWIAGVGDIQLTFGTPEPLPQLELPSLEQVPSHVVASWAFVSTGYWLTGVAASLPSVETWHHLASSYGGGSFRFYVDGALASSMDGVEPVANPANTLYLGATARHEHTFDSTLGTQYWPPIDGFIAEVRLSSGNRYPVEFVPEARLHADASTLALWHLDEGDGSVVSDSGPGQVNGSITGAEWAVAPIRTGQSSL
jgi:Concanavalin A-like lectin/glucanases superfamily